MYEEKVFSILKSRICIYLTKCGFGQKIDYLANCVMQVCCCVKNLDSKTVLYIVFLWLYEGGDTWSSTMRERSHTDTNSKTSKVKRQHWICVISASGFPRVTGLILFSLLHELT